MRYVALLRGINVGGKNKVAMSRLRETFEELGGTNVRTYINSGNVVFSHDEVPAEDLAIKLELAISDEFGLEIRVLVLDAASITQVARAIPDSWVNDRTMRARVIFLWDEVDTPEILDQIPVREEIDEVAYVPGAVMWRVDFDSINRSGMGKLVGTKPYQSMTIRNVNTVRKLVSIIDEPSDS